MRQYNYSYVPGVVFAFPWGYYADTSGRRRALLISSAGGFLFGAVSSFAPSWQFMLIVKLIGSSLYVYLLMLLNYCFFQHAMDVESYSLRIPIIF